MTPLYSTHFWDVNIIHNYLYIKHNSPITVLNVNNKLKQSLWIA